MVYFIEIEGTTYVKVGRAASPERRLSELSTAHPFVLKIRHVINTRDGYADSTLEKRIHTYLKTHRLRGEWFDLSLEKLTQTINYFEEGLEYAANPVIAGYLYMRSTVKRMEEGHLQTVTEPCFFCHREHLHGAIGSVIVQSDIQSYGHRVAHCPMQGIERKHPNGQVLSNDRGYYLWIENHEAERLNRIKMKPFATYFPESEYYYPD